MLIIQCEDLTRMCCGVSSNPCMVASARGHLSCLRFYARSGNGEINQHMSFLAAKNGHLDCLVFLYESGCPISSMSRYASEKFGHDNCVRYIDSL